MLKGLSPKSGWVQADLSRDEDCRRAVTQTQAHWGQIYGLVNNAGSNAAWASTPHPKPSAPRSTGTCCIPIPSATCCKPTSRPA
ncbi:hypothetical protein [Cypionkella sp.]|uniref:hypothetical protein n=1 Tax=Cypionkella sp. TaxID=2811411 RepID=UPI003A0FBF32